MSSHLTEVNSSVVKIMNSPLEDLSPVPRSQDERLTPAYNSRSWEQCAHTSLPICVSKNIKINLRKQQQQPTAGIQLKGRMLV